MAELGLSKSMWGFDPRAIPRCASWIDAADTNTLTRSGNNVTAIRDKASYANYTVTGAGGATTGLLTLNGNNLITVTNDCSITAGIPLSNRVRHLFCVVQIDGSTSGVTPRTYNFFNGSFVFGSMALLYAHGDGSIIGGTNGYNAARVASNNIPSTFFNAASILSYQNDAVSNNTIRLNGTALPLSTDLSFGFNTSGGVNQLVGGTIGVEQEYRLGELLFYDNSLSTSNRQAVEGYLAWKWGLTAKLPVAHPYLSTPPFSTAFQVTSVPNCVLWLDAADKKTITLSGSNVSQWSDKSGANNHAVQATSSNQPVLVDNVRSGQPVVRVSGIVGANRTDTRFLENSTMAFPNAPYTIFAVAQAASNVAYSYTYLFKPSRATDYYFMMGSLTNSFTAFAGSATAWNDTAVISGTQPTSNWTVFTIVNRGTAAGLVPYIDNNIRNAKNGTTAACTGYTLGDAPVGFRGQNWNGDIAEIIVFNRDLSIADQTRIEGYLAWKWGTTSKVPAAFPYAATRLNPQGIL